MSEIILHHYAISPFSEKVRLVLGLKQMRWRSVTIPPILPKPDVVALTGGYRRTPFMQIGADVYCDSALVCRVLDRIAPEPPLYPAASRGLDEIVAQWADTALFWTAVPFTMQPAGAAHVLGSAPETLKAFAADRAAMNPAMRRAPVTDGAAVLAVYLGRLDALLANDRRFLLGDAPCIADVAAAQSPWFMRLAPPVGDRLEAFPRVVAWFERVAAFGHGEAAEMSSAAAIEVAAGARSHAPCSVAPGQGFEAGTEVTVVPADYAHDEVVGTLVGLDANESVLARRDARAGDVHVHFPRIGYHLRAVRKEGT
jgi:glutathione S-transferase